MEWDKSKLKRNMPWVGEKDSYKIWLSEIILQQTRVEQGLNYYLALTKKYPTVFDLANANETELFKLWQGLGYYNRCQNMLWSAKFIVEHYQGIFPKKYDEVLALKGIGAYTAAAICSFAYNQPYAVLDGNVFRVLSRFFCIEKNIDEPEGRNFFKTLSQELLDKKEPSLYNQAIMDFGAMICKSKLPLCNSCVLAKKCVAYNENTIPFFPIKKKKNPLKNRFFQIIIFRKGAYFYVKKRTGSDVWKNLYQFYIIENEKMKTNDWKILGFLKEPKPVFETQQKLSHQHLHLFFYELDLKLEKDFLSDYEMVTLQKLKQLPFPKEVASFIKLNF